jgi:hypothetical protein
MDFGEESHCRRGKIYQKQVGSVLKVLSENLGNGGDTPEHIYILFALKQLGECGTEKSLAVTECDL